jgi:hypothetical protein
MVSLAVGSMSFVVVVLLYNCLCWIFFLILLSLLRLLIVVILRPPMGMVVNDLNERERERSVYRHCDFILENDHSSSIIKRF